MNKVTTLNQFIIEQQAGVPQATGGFSCLLHHVGIAAKKVNREVNKAGLVDILGRAGSENVQGEDQQKLDIYANETFLSELKASAKLRISMTVYSKVVTRLLPVTLFMALLRCWYIRPATE